MLSAEYGTGVRLGWQSAIKELNAEYAQVLAEKKKTYSEYRQARQEMKDYQTAKYNIDRFLQTEEQEKQAEKQKQNTKAR